ncbi:MULTISPECIES: hypothetical protein [unclassified Bacillus (in: firmicutes)]|uniref:hypothetical protein n=1 Tax=unclassified Bacillus (in: firmicutes) TaxID=185979 RepID=UPI0008E681D4|nr:MULTISPECIES: hypothetical protein [unclassified Bacillus (in: firmicutes)]SFI02111.1 hypothetical protein SAMN04488574_101285 [Bacillus sp. 71mf]SFS91876.1 hypothetical protein SAMN04488145_1055 [Bacillus sp. 103mf]
MRIEELYPETDWCMKFTNEEILKYFVEPLSMNSDVDIRVLSDDEEIPKDSDKQIETVCLDGEKQELFINFLECQTSIFIMDTEIMFIDDNAKKNYTSSDTAYNVVYEGNLRCMTHKEILEMLAEIISYCIGTYEIYVEEEKMDNLNHSSYQTFKYDVNLKANKSEKKKLNYNNIYINIE